MWWEFLASSMCVRYGSVACSNEQCNTSVTLIKCGEFLSTSSIICFPVRNILVFHEVSWFLSMWADCLLLAHQPPWARASSFTRFLDLTHNDASQSVGFLWTSDQLVAEISTWQHTTLTTDKHPYPRWDSNPQSQQTFAVDRAATGTGEQIVGLFKSV